MRVSRPKEAPQQQVVVPIRVLGTEEVLRDFHRSLRMATSVEDGVEICMPTKEVETPPPQTQAPYSVPLDRDAYHDQVTKLIPSFLRQFDGLIKPYVWLSTLFGVAIAFELISLALFFPSLNESALLAVSLAALFFTTFSFFLIRVYFQAKGPEQLSQLKDRYLKSCRHIIHYQENIPEHHMALANAATRFAAALKEREYSYYTPPQWLATLKPTLQRFSAWWHWADVHRMRELLYHCAIQEQIHVIKLEPIHLEVHAALANSYVLLSSLYAPPEKKEEGEEQRWTPAERLQPGMEERFRSSSTQAIEEFQILSDYAPNDPWVHSQLAYSYHDLQMPEEEIKAYQTILKLRPNDKETLFKLGLLYFELGKNSQGLKIYEQLKRSHYKKAETLIKFYGSGGV